MWCVSSTVHLHKSGHVNSLMLSWFVEHSMFRKLWHLLIHLSKTWSFNFGFYACFQWFLIKLLTRFQDFVLEFSGFCPWPMVFLRLSSARQTLDCWVRKNHAPQNFNNPRYVVCDFQETATSDHQLLNRVLCCQQGALVATCTNLSTVN